MSLSPDRAVEAISGHSAGLADAAEHSLGAPVEHCPDWSVADLVAHVTDVHWLWRTVVADNLTAPPNESLRPPRAADDDLIAVFRTGADKLTTTLHDADQTAACWTWYPPLQQVSFVTRHQVQEAAIHHWDAAHAVGQDVAIDTDLAVDAVEEFLTCSLADADDAVRVGATLDGELVLHATDAERWWSVRQDAPDAPLLWSVGGDTPSVEATAADLLLWIYGRRRLPEHDPALVQRFRRLASTT